MTSKYRVTVEILDARDDSHISMWGTTITDGDDVADAVGLPFVAETEEQQEHLYGTYDHDIIVTRALMAVVGKTLAQSVGRNVIQPRGQDT